MLYNPSVYIHPLFLSPGLFLYLTLLYDSISPAVMRKTVRTCVFVSVCIQVCMHVILYNPTPSVMTVITSISTHL